MESTLALLNAWAAVPIINLLIGALIGTVVSLITGWWFGREARRELHAESAKLRAESAKLLEGNERVRELVKLSLRLSEQPGDRELIVDSATGDPKNIRFYGAGTATVSIGGQGDGYSTPAEAPPDQ